MTRLMLVLTLSLPLAAGELKPNTLSAFDQYIRQAEQKLDDRKGFLWADESPDRAAKARQGGLVVEPTGRKPLIDVPDGLVHDWMGTVFIPGASLDRVMAFVRDYDREKDFYKPEVIDSKTLSHDGNHYHIYLRLLKKKVITVVLNTEHDVDYAPVDANRWRSVSRTTKIAEVKNAGKKDETELPPGTGEGFLWRLNSYWRFQERDRGVWVECEAISLTRDIPTGLGWLIRPIVRDLPRESLENTLRSLRAGMGK